MILKYQDGNKPAPYTANALYQPVADNTNRQVRGRQGLHQYLTTGDEPLVVGVNETYGKHSGEVMSTYPASGAIDLTPITEDPIFMLATAGGITASMKGSGFAANVADEFTGGLSSLGRVVGRKASNFIGRRNPTEGFFKVSPESEFTHDAGLVEAGQEQLGKVYKRTQTKEGRRRMQNLGADPDEVKKIELAEIDKLDASMDMGNRLLGDDVNPYIEMGTFHKSRIPMLVEHEFQHFIQGRGGATTEIDEMLKGLTLRKTKPFEVKGIKDFNADDLYQWDFDTKGFTYEDMFWNFNAAEDYLKHNADEGAPFLAELRQYMLENKHIKNPYTKITPKKVRKVYEIWKSQKTDPVRLFNIIEDTDKNFNLLSVAMNKLPSIFGAGAIGTGLYSNQSELYPKY